MTHDLTFSQQITNIDNAQCINITDKSNCTEAVALEYELFEQEITYGQSELKLKNYSKVYDGKQIQITDIIEKAAYGDINAEVSDLTIRHRNVNEEEYTDGLPPAEAGEYWVDVILNSKIIDNVSYHAKGFATRVEIRKAIPEFDLLSKFTVCIDTRLSEISLPKNYEFESGDILFTKIGDEYVNIIYTPEDQANFQTIKFTAIIEVVSHSGGYANCLEKAKCDRCGKEYGELGEHVLETKEGIIPTCVDNGKTEETYCTVCHETVSGGAVIPALGHDFGDWSIIEEPTSKQEGLKTHTCKRCGFEETETIAKLSDGSDDNTYFYVIIFVISGALLISVVGFIAFKYLSKKKSD